MSKPGHLGEGIGWRPELARAIERRAGLGFVELIAEDFFDRPIPRAIDNLRERGVAVVPHAISLSLGGGLEPDRGRLDRLARLAERVSAPLVSEHLSFVRAGGLESGHLLPLPRTREALDVVVANVRLAQAALPVPLALENVATLFEWPGAEMGEADFLRAVLEETGAWLLLDVENVYANARNQGYDARAYLEAVPLNRIAYVHIAGGVEQGGTWHDTHTHPVAEGALELLAELSERVEVPGVMLERDDRFPGEAELYAEMDAIAAAVTRGGRGMSLGDARRRLAAQQGALVQALVAGGEVPAGFDARGVAVAARSLVNKRLREVALAWPALVEGLGDRFAERFRAYAMKAPPPEGGPLADGEAFARSLPPEERGDVVERRLLRLDLGRRVAGVSWARLPVSGRRVVGVALPGLGVRVWG